MKTMTGAESFASSQEGNRLLRHFTIDLYDTNICGLYYMSAISQLHALALYYNECSRFVKSGLFIWYLVIGRTRKLLELSHKCGDC